VILCAVFVQIGAVIVIVW